MNEVYGMNPVLELLHSSSQVSLVYLVEEPSERQKELLQVAKERGIEIRFLPRQEFRKRFGEKTQGVVAMTPPYLPLGADAFLSRLQARPDSILLIMDQVQDPQNLGALLRTAEAAGVEGVAVSQHGSAPFTPAVFKASAGALSHLSVCRVPSLNWFLEKLKEKGYWIAGTDAERGEPLYSTSIPFPVAFLLGSEGQGIRPLLLRRCDLLLRIPLFGKVNSLNVSVAGGIFLFELRRRMAISNLPCNPGFGRIAVNS
jgi:23S rRNA (guanosine2251-2'-O)-methyltransferase